MMKKSKLHLGMHQARQVIALCGHKGAQKLGHKFRCTITKERAIPKSTNFSSFILFNLPHQHPLLVGAVRKHACKRKVG
jgi:hypothetical protein